MNEQENAVKVSYRENVICNVDRCIDDAITSTVTARKKVQIAIVSIVYCAQKDGDTRKPKQWAEKLIDGTTGLNQRGIVEAFKRQGAIVVDGEGITGWDTSKLDLQDAKDTYWWTLKPQNPWGGLDLHALLHKLVTQADGAIEKTEKDPSLSDKVNIDPDMLAVLKAIDNGRPVTVH